MATGKYSIILIKIIPVCFSQIFKIFFFAHHVELKTSGKGHSREFDVSCVYVFESGLKRKTGGKTFEYVLALESIEFNENLIGFHKFTARLFLPLPQCRILCITFNINSLGMLVQLWLSIETSGHFNNKTINKLSCLTRFQLLQSMKDEIKFLSDEIKINKELFLLLLFDLLWLK